MAATTAAATFLLVLSVLVTPAFMQNCNFTATLNGSGIFNITLSPATYTPNTNYSVTVNGTTEMTRLTLHSVDSAGNAAGQWIIPAGTNCTNSSMAANSATTSFSTSWTSPSSTTATINAYVTTTPNATYNSTATFTQASPPASTIAATTANATTIAATTANANATTAKGNSKSVLFSSCLLLVAIQSAFVLLVNRGLVC